MSSLNAEIRSEIERELELSIAQICARLDLVIDECQRQEAVKAAKRALSPVPLPGELPECAPELYAERSVISGSGRRENIVEFLRRVWKPWMDADLLSRSDLRRLDPAAEKAVENWLLRNSDMPDDINLLVCVRTLRKPSSVRALGRPLVAT